MSNPDGHKDYSAYEKHLQKVTDDFVEWAKLADANEVTRNLPGYIRDGLNLLLILVAENKKLGNL